MCTVSDTYNNRIQKFDSDGNFITKWGTRGEGDSQFKEPLGITTDLQGYVYVVDSSNGRIQKFDSNGSFVKKFGNFGYYDGELNNPRAIDVDIGGNIYVADTQNDRILRFQQTTNGTDMKGASTAEVQDNDRVMATDDSKLLQTQKEPTTTTSKKSINILKGADDSANKNSYIPQKTAIKRGTVVTWINDDTTLHTVTSGSPIRDDPGEDFDSGFIATGKTFHHNFEFAGTFEYYCILHPFMKGEIVYNEIG